MSHPVYLYIYSHLNTNMSNPNHITQLTALNISMEYPDNYYQTNPIKMVSHFQYLSHKVQD